MFGGRIDVCSWIDRCVGGGGGIVVCTRTGTQYVTLLHLKIQNVTVHTKYM